MLSASVIVILVLCFCVMAYNRQQRARRKMQSKIEAFEDEKMSFARERTYFMNKIMASQIQFGKQLARGAEGEVWSGRLIGHDYRGPVAIKRALPLPDDKGSDTLRMG